MTLPSTNLSASLINTELGFDSTRTVSFNDATVRALFGQASGSINASAGQNKAAPPRILAWTSSFPGGTSLPQLEISDVIQDSQSRTIIVGSQRTSNTGSAARAFIICLAADGVTILWQKSYSAMQGNTFTRFSGVAVGPDDSIYACSYGIFGWSGSHVVKYNSSGELQWNRGLIGENGTDELRLFDITADSTGNVYCVGERLSGGTSAYDGVLVKYNSLGTLQWQRGWDNSASYVFLVGVATDSAGNAYCTGWTTNTPAGSSGYVALVAKFNGSGTVVWERTLLNPASPIGKSHRQSRIIVDPVTGSTYFSGWTETTNTPAGQRGCLTKLDTAGNLVWTHEFGSVGATSGSDQITDLILGPDGQIWCCHYNFNTLGSWTLAVISSHSPTTGEVTLQRYIGQANVPAQTSQPVRIFFDQWGTINLALGGYTSNTSVYFVGIFRLRPEATGARVGTAFSFAAVNGQAVLKNYTTAAFASTASTLAVVASSPNSAYVSSFAQPTVLYAEDVLTYLDLASDGEIFAYNNTLPYDVQSTWPSGNSASISVESNGSITIYGTNSFGGPTAYFNFLAYGVGSQFEARVLNFQGTINGSGYFYLLDTLYDSNSSGSTAFLNLGTTRIIALVPSQGDSISLYFTLEIRRISTGAVVSRSGYMSMSY